MGVRWQRIAESHKWRWWTAVSSVATVVGLAVAVLAWWCPRSLADQEPEDDVPSRQPTSATTQNNSIFSSQFSVIGRDTTTQEVTVSPLTIIQLQIRYENIGRDVQENVLMQLDLPDQITYLPDTTRLRNGSNQNGTAISDNIVANGINVGNYNPHAAAYVAFAVQVEPPDRLRCGLRTLAPQATVSINDVSISSEVLIHVEKRC